MEKKIMMKSLAIATAAVAFGGAALLTPHTSAQAASPAAKSQEIVVAAAFGGHGKANRHRKPSRVQAVGISRGALVPYFLKKANAQRKAISSWRSKVSRTYGARYANWSRAVGKSTRCSRAGISVTCRVSAVPNTPFRRFGALN